METIVDIDVYGRLGVQNTLTEHQNDKAISNAMVLYLTSNSGDFLLAPEKGGILKRILFKITNEQLLNEKTKEIVEALELEFGAVAKNIECELTHDGYTKLTEVNVFWESSLSGEENQVQFFSKNSLEAEVRRIYIPFIGDNLLAFCILKKDEQTGIRISKDSIENIYVWGQYAFSNFTELDSNYNDIILICNEGT